MFDSLFCQSESNLKYIDPTIGNVAPLLNPNRPIVQLPHQMIRFFPYRYDHLDLEITSFPLTALNIITPQVVFAIKPISGEVMEETWSKKLLYDHDLEINEPWYYSTELIEDGVRVEYTAGKMGGVFRFTFPDSVKKNLLLSHWYEGGTFDITNNNEIRGVEYVDDAHHQQHGIAYVYGKFSGNPIMEKSDGEINWGKYSVGTWGGNDPSIMDGEKLVVAYSEDEVATIEFRYAISFIDKDQAKINFNEIENITFENLVENGVAEWDKVINQIEVKGGTDSDKRSFYTSLYRCYSRMSVITENGNKYYSGYDNSVHQDIRTFYVDDYSWGNYLAFHPLHTILNPATESDMLESYVRMYKQSGWMPDYPKHFGDREGMFGFHSSVMFLDAYRKGIENVDYKVALDGIFKSATEATMLPSRNGPKGELEEFYYEKGYYPALHPGEEETDPLVLKKHGQKRSSVALTLAHSYDGWAAGELAKELGNMDIYNHLYGTRNNYKNLWHDDMKFFMPKDSSGNWIDINPTIDGGFAGLDYYNENNGWMYLWNVQHDLDGLVQLMGGKDSFEFKLDRLFTEGLGMSKNRFYSIFPDQTGLIGNYGVGNQVSFFIPYLYNYTNAPWKTQKITRLILDTWFKDNVLGVPGDEDGGSMSAFVVFTYMGFYPIQPGKPFYTISSPVFSEILINLKNGNKFIIKANNSSKKNKYIQSAHMNGKKLEKPWFSHNDLMKGGTLILEMGERPNEFWNEN